ncbi:MAG: NrsF family protein [Terracidiphilus sp.]
MKDEEIDDLLKKAARAPHEVKAETLERAADSIKATLVPVRPLPPAWVMTGGVMLVCAAVSLAGAARAGFFGFAKMDLLERALIFPALLLFAWAAGNAFVDEMIPGSLRRVSPGALLGFGCAALLGVFGFLFRDYHTDHFVSVGIVCLLTGLLHALPAGLLSWLVLRRGFAVNFVSAGLAAGMLGGLAGVGVLELHCPNFEAAHVLVWHTAVVPLSGLLGALAGWALRLRSGSLAPAGAGQESSRRAR